MNTHTKFILLIFATFLIISCTEDPPPLTPTIPFNYTKLHAGERLDLYSDLIVKGNEYTMYIDDLEFNSFSTQDSLLQVIVPMEAKHGMVSIEYDNQQFNLGEVEIYHMYVYDLANKRIDEIGEYHGKQMKTLYDFGNTGEVEHMVYSQETNSLVGSYKASTERHHFILNVETLEFKSFLQEKLDDIILDNDGRLYGLKDDMLLELDITTGDILNEYQWTSGEELFLNPINNTIRLRSYNQPISFFEWHEFDLNTKTSKIINLPETLYRHIILDDGKMFALTFDELLEMDTEGNVVEKIRDFEHQSEIVFSEASQHIYLFYMHGGNFDLIKFNLDYEFKDYSQDPSWYTNISIGKIK